MDLILSIVAAVALFALLKFLLKPLIFRKFLPTRFCKDRFPVHNACVTVSLQQFSVLCHCRKGADLSNVRNLIVRQAILQISLLIKIEVIRSLVPGVHFAAALGRQDVNITDPVIPALQNQRAVVLKQIKIAVSINVQWIDQNHSLPMGLQFSHQIQMHGQNHRNR